MHPTSYIFDEAILVTFFVRMSKTNICSDFLKFCLSSSSNYIVVLTKTSIALGHWCRWDQYTYSRRNPHDPHYFCWAEWQSDADYRTSPETVSCFVRTKPTQPIKHLPRLLTIRRVSTEDGENRTLRRASGEPCTQRASPSSLITSKRYSTHKWPHLQTDFCVF